MGLPREVAGTGALWAVLFCDAASTSVSACASFEALAALARQNGATHIEQRGQGLLALLPQPNSALRCAHDVREVSAHLGFGVSFGEVYETEGELFGSVVVEAARLHQTAEPGQILVADLAADLAGTTADGTAQSIGLVALKGFDEPVAVSESLAVPPTSRSDNAATNTDDTDDGGTKAPWRPRLDVDMVNSTGLLAEVGDVEAARVQARYQAAVEECARIHSGEVVLRHGDGFVVTFATASAACEAGLRLVRAVAEGNLALGATPFEIRVGISCTNSTDSNANSQAELVDRSEPGRVIADRLTATLSRDRGIAFLEAGDQTFYVGLANKANTNPSDNTRSQKLDGLDSFVLPLPHALSASVTDPLVGRASQVNALTDAYRQAALGELVVAEVAGVPGMGKTAVVAAATQAVATEGAMVLFGACDPELDVPFGPVRDALAQAAEHAPDLADQIAAAFGANQEASLAHDQQPVDERERVFNRVAAVVEELARRRPLVLVIDDVHWLTTSTALVVRHLASVLRRSRLLIIATFRPAEISQGHPVRHLKADLGDLGIEAVAVNPSPLDPLAVAELVASAFNAPLSEDALALADRLSADTGGAPFFIGEVVREMTTSGLLMVENGRVEVGGGGEVDALPIPATVRGAIDGRLSRLDTSVHDTLSMAACVGPTFSLDVLARAFDRPFTEIVDAVEAAARIALVREGEQARTYTFAHALVRSTLLFDATATRIASRHEAIARSFESMPGDHLDELARHWLEAAGPEAETKAVEYLLAAAQRDADALAWEAAAGRYQSVLDRLDHLTTLGDATRAEAWLGLGWARRAAGDGDFLDTMIEAGRQARRAERPDLLARAAIGGMKPGTWFNNANETNDLIVGFCEDALGGLHDDDPLRVEVLSILATSLAFEDAGVRRQQLVDEAVDLARRLGDPHLVASALVAEHLAMWSPATLPRRREIADELGRIARRRDLIDLEFLARFFHTSILLETCEVDAAKAEMKNLAPLIERTGNFWFRFLVERMRIGLAIAQDEPGTAAMADALFTEAGETQADAAGTWAAQHGGIAIHERRFGDMVGSLEKAAAGRLGQGIWSYALVNAFLDRGGPGDREAANKLADALVEPNVDFMWLVTMQMLAEAGHGLEREDLCRKALDALLPYRGRLGVIASGTLTYALVSTSIGQAAIGVGDLRLAAECLEEAVGQAQAMGSPFFEQRSRELLQQATSGRVAQT